MSNVANWLLTIAVIVLAIFLVLIYLDMRAWKKAFPNEVETPTK